jgi:hypothetical protein
MSLDGLSRARKRVQEAIEKAEAEQKHRLQVARIDLAKQGIRAFQQNRQSESARKLAAYIRILEDWKGVEEGDLTPSLFDAKKDAAELLLISGVYWIMVQIFDRTKDNKPRKEFLHYLEKYIVFCKGMVYQRLCAETLRKYISMGKSRNKAELKNAYKMIGVTKCFIATALVDVTDPQTLPRLRRFRDEVLKEKAAGRLFIAWYYRQGPRLAEFVDGKPEIFRRTMGRALDLIARAVG